MLQSNDISARKYGGKISKISKQNVQRPNQENTEVYIDDMFVKSLQSKERGFQCIAKL